MNRNHNKLNPQIKLKRPIKIRQDKLKGKKNIFKIKVNFFLPIKLNSFSLKVLMATLGTICVWHLSDNLLNIKIVTLFPYSISIFFQYVVSFGKCFLSQWHP